MHQPANYRRIFIVGAGGFGREVLHWARKAWPQDAHRIAGFLSHDPRRLDRHSCELDIVGDPATFRFETDDSCLLAIGIPSVRRMVAESVLSRGGRFLTLIHPAAIVAPTASIGEGSIVCPYAIVSDCCRLGRFVLMNYHSSLGHDAAAGDFAVLSPYATLGGGASLDADVFLALHASVGPGNTVREGSYISANCAVLNDVPPRSLVFGVPGRIAPWFAISDGPSP